MMRWPPSLRERNDSTPGIRHMLALFPDGDKSRVLQRACGSTFRCRT